MNTALAAGDELYTGQSANLELQVGARAFVRAGENTQLALTSLEPDFLQLRVTAGHVSLDLRSLKTGQTFELDTPNAAFSIERSGYYRVEVDGETTSFTSRRGGRASVTPASGDSAAIAPSEQVVVSGADAPQIESYAAPELDAWDRWNYARTDDQLDAVSARYVPSGVYGADDLDHYGDWRVVPTYGAIWVPRGVAAGWAPYSSGRWVYDPYFAWTWVDNAPWGWAPYHYGRWVHVSGYWGWCPGPIVARPYYSPALVAFYGGGGFYVGITIGTPYVGWVALGWGEPVVPWWGPAHYRGNPHWAGWGGPRVVNKVVIKNKTVIKGDQINNYQNADVHDAIVGVDRKHFGRRSRENTSFARMRADKLAPLHGELDVRPDRSSLVAEDRAAKRPPREQSEALRRRDARAAARCPAAARSPAAIRSRDGSPGRRRARRTPRSRRAWCRRRARARASSPRSVRPSARRAMASGRFRGPCRASRSRNASRRRRCVRRASACERRSRRARASRAWPCRVTPSRGSAPAPRPRRRRVPKSTLRSATLPSPSARRAARSRDRSARMTGAGSSGRRARRASFRVSPRTASTGSARRRRRRSRTRANEPRPRRRTGGATAGTSARAGRPRPLATPGRTREEGPRRR